MSKKQSYMNNENVLSEGLLDKIIRSIIPKSIQKTVTKKAVTNMKKENQKLETEISDIQSKIQKLEQRKKASSERLHKAIEKQYGVKIKQKTTQQAIKDFYGE